VRFLLLNQTFYPDVAATGQYLTEVALALAKCGHQVTVVTSRRAYNRPDLQFPKHEHWGGVQIFRVSATGFGKAAKWRRAADFASFLAACAWRLARLPRHDVVVALTSPPLISFLGAWLARLRGSRFCYWVMDLNPDEAIAAGWLRCDSFAARVLEAMSRFSLREAGKVIALDRFMEDRIMAKGIAPQKIVVLPLWSHDNEVRFDPEGRERFRRAHGLEKKFVVMYSGNHSPCHPLDTLLEAAEQLKTEDSVAFCFIGGGGEFDRVRRWAQQGEHAQVVCLPYRPLNELSGSLSAADLHVVVMGDAFVGLVAPCKIYNILAVGAPVLYIGPPVSHVSEIAARANGDLSWFPAKHGEVERVVEQIQKARGTVQARRGGPVARRVEFSRETGLSKLIAELETSEGRERV
jgi:glycosyltransferase involved in cell wall biosynthesis